MSAMNAQGAQAPGPQAAQGAQAQASAAGPAPTSAPERAGGTVAQSAAPEQAEAQTTGSAGTKATPAKARPRRGTRAALRSYAVASLITCSLVGFGGLAVSQPEVIGAPDAGYAAALDQAVSQADALPQLAQAAGSTTSTAAQRQEFSNAASDLATQIPRVAADAPPAQVEALTRAAGALSSYSGTVTRAGVTGTAATSGAGSVASATDIYRQQVQQPLSAMQSEAEAGAAAWLPVTIFGLLSVIALATLVGGAISLASRTRRMFNVPVTVGILLLGGVITAGALTASGSLIWPVGLAGATLLTGGIVAGVSAATGFLQRLQEYR